MYLEIINCNKLIIYNSGNESLVGSDGFGLGSHVILNSGMMSHGTIGGENTGLSKALVMSLVLFMVPLTDKVPLNFDDKSSGLRVNLKMANYQP